MKESSRIVLKRNSPPIGLWLGLLFDAFLLGPSMYPIIADWNWLSGFGVVYYSAFGIVEAAAFVSMWRLLRRKIVLLEEYISFSNWYGQPKIYGYSDIVDLQTVIVSRRNETRWEFESNVKVIFSGGQKLRIPESMMHPHEVRKFIESKTGLTFGSKLNL